MSRDRHQARILAMQALSQWDALQDESLEVLDELFITLEASGATAVYAKDLVTTFWARRKNVDRRIRTASTGWDPIRMSPVDRNAMRVAIVEMLDTAVPRKVALNEAIDIGREYGGKESPRFINGVLDQVLKDLPAHQGKPPASPGDSSEPRPPGSDQEG